MIPGNGGQAERMKGGVNGVRICQNCGERLGKTWVKAGRNGTEFCSRECAYEGLDYFGKEYVDRTLVEYPAE